MTPKRSNLAWYADWLAAVEEVFGRRWLEKKRRLIANGVQVHRMVSTWQSAVDWLASAEATGKAEFTPELVAFFDVGHDLHMTKALPGFAKAFTPRRLKGDAWENDIYVAHVAALALRSGYQVSFIPPAKDDEVKTADLQIGYGEQSFFVECKKKDSYIRPGDAEAAWPSLQEKLAVLHPKVQDDYEVVVACVGTLAHEAVPALSAAAASFVEQALTGNVVVPEFDATVLIKKNPPRPPGVEGAWIPAWQNPGSAQITMTVGDDGAPTYGPLFRSCLYIIDAHRSAQVLSSLRDARSQIPRQMSGVVFVAVDTTGIPEGDHDLYFSVLSAWLSRELTRTDNARVLAVVLTGGLARIELTPDRAFHRSLRHWCIVRNPNGPSAFVVPGEARQPDA